MEEKKPFYPGLSYCIDCKTVKFEAEAVPKGVLQKNEITEPTDGSFWAVCRVCKSIEGINLLAGFFGIPLAGTTKHRALKAALHVPFMDPDGIRRGLTHVEVEERTAPTTVAAPEGKNPALTPEEEARIRAEVESALRAPPPKPPESQNTP